MGFFDSIKSVFSTAQTAEDKSAIKIPQEVLEEFQNGVEGQLKIIEAGLFKIEKVYQVGAMQIEEKIAQIRADMEKDIPQAKIDIQLEELKATVKAYTQKANQRYSIDQAKAAVNRVKQINSTITKSGESNKNREALESEEKYIASLSNRISDFQGQERDNLIAILMEARYRIAIGKLLVLETSNSIYGDKFQICDFFKNVSEVEKIMYGKFLMDDMNELITRYNLHCKLVEYLEEMSKQIEEEYPDFVGTHKARTEDDTSTNAENELESKRVLALVDAKTNGLQDQFYNDLMNDFQITGLFSNRDFLLDFAETYATLNSVAKQLEIDRQSIESQREQAKQAQDEQAKRKALEEKYKNMTDEETQAEIERIDRETFDLKQKYKRIIEFQVAIAQARGLIGQKETMQGEDMAFLPCKTSEVPSLIEKLNESSIFNNAMIGVDDNRGTSIIMVPKANEGAANSIRVEEDEYPDRYYITGKKANNLVGSLIGKLSGKILEMIPENDRPYFAIKRENQNRYLIYEINYINGDVRRGSMQRLYQAIINTNLSDPTKQNIKFSIQLPLQRGFLPVIEQLKQAGIEFYIPPIDIPGFDFRKTEPTYRIYIDRKYLKKYKEQVHQELNKKGLVIIGDEEPKLSEMLLQDCEFPYGLDKEKEH